MSTWLRHTFATSQLLIQRPRQWSGRSGLCGKYNIEALRLPSSYHPSLDLIGINGCMLGHAYRAPMIPLFYNPFLDLTRIGGPGESQGYGMVLSSSTAYSFSGRTRRDDAYMASITGNLSGLPTLYRLILLSRLSLISIARFAVDFSTPVRLGSEVVVE